MHPRPRRSTSSCRTTPRSIEAKFSEPERGRDGHRQALRRADRGRRNCLQMGIGAIPNAVLSPAGRAHKNLGIHTEMFADGVLPLVEKRRDQRTQAKNTDPGKMVSTFLMGSQKPFTTSSTTTRASLMMDVGYTNDPYVIAQESDRFDGHQLGPASRPDGPGVRRLAGHEILVGRRRTNRLRLRRIASRRAARRSSPCLRSPTRACQQNLPRTLLDGAGVVTTRNAHPLVRDRVRSRGPLRQDRCRSVHAC